MRKGIHFSGFILDGENSTPISLIISAPSISEEDAYCEIHAPALLRRCIKIYGVDAEQAWQLSVGLIGKMLFDRRLVDTQGRPAEFI